MDEQPVLEGLKILQKAVKDLPEQPGVYHMLSADGKLLYVGKAKNLKKRVSNYTNLNRLNSRLERMVFLTRSLKYITTRTEAEALLLEANIIRKEQPRFNVRLKDDATYPYIVITDHDFPRIMKYRGRSVKNSMDISFGPFASAEMVTETVMALQKAFMLRSCSDNVFTGRNRPCLEYQIKRCTAPCVGYVSKSGYGSQVKQVTDFISGKKDGVLSELSERMSEASDDLRYEDAAIIRNKIKALNSIRLQSRLYPAGLNDADVISLIERSGKSCVQVFSLRGGLALGQRNYTLNSQEDTSRAEMVEAFITQYYGKLVIPKVIITSDIPENIDELVTIFSEMAGNKVLIRMPDNQSETELMQMVTENGSTILAKKMEESTNFKDNAKKLADLLNMNKPPERIEVYDNSHIFGSHAVGAMVVAGREGFEKAQYRKFNIKEIMPIGGGDDIAMMREVFNRRFKASTEIPIPDLIIIDGGQTQLNAAIGLIPEGITVISLSKGVDRNAGLEEIHIPDHKPFRLDKHDPIQYFLQRLRDEAHRYAISSYRKRHLNSLEVSSLDNIENIGKAKKKALLMHFGSAKAVAEASISELMQVKNIGKNLAQDIYLHFHGKSDG